VKTNPIQSQTQLAPRPALRFEKTKPILGKGKSKKAKGKMRVNPAVFRACDLKKQSQFADRLNCRKLLFERTLWQ